MRRFSQTESNQFSGLTVCHSHNITIWKSQWGSLLSIISACSSQDFLCNVWTVLSMNCLPTAPLPSWKILLTLHSLSFMKHFQNTKSFQGAHDFGSFQKSPFPNLQFSDFLFLKTISWAHSGSSFLPTPLSCAFTSALLHFKNLTIMYCSGLKPLETIKQLETAQTSPGGRV